MTFESIMTFLIANNKLVIEVLLALVLLTVIVAAFNAFVLSDEESGKSATGGIGNVSELEEAIKRILEKANTMQVPAGASGADLEKLNALSNEINALKKDIEDKKNQISQLEASASKGGGADSAALQKKIGELESKLAEYEIISEDIADLSYYKEQFTKLQKENDELRKGGGAVAAAVTTAPSAASVSEAESNASSDADAVSKDESSSAKSSAEDNNNSESSSSAASASDVKIEPVEDVSSVVDDDLMAEFAKAVEMQKAGGASAASAAEPAAAAAPIPAAQSTESLVAAAETETPAVESKSSESNNISEENPLEKGEIDIDKMVNEASGISSDGPDVNLEQALGETINEDKILAEATALEVPSEDQKLMGDFENFVKNE